MKTPITSKHHVISGQKDKKGTIQPVKVDNVIIDLESIFSIEHHCGKNACNTKTNCCAKYEICINKSELSTIIGTLPIAARYSRHLKSGKGYSNVFEQVTPNLFSIDTTFRGLCVFAFVKSGRIRCSLHSAAVETGIPPHEIKPKACAVWPLAISKDRHRMVLSVDDDAYRFDCNSQVDSSLRLISPSIGDIIHNIMGSTIRDKIRMNERGQRRDDHAKHI